MPYRRAFNLNSSVFLFRYQSGPCRQGLSFYSLSISSKTLQPCSSRRKHNSTGTVSAASLDLTLDNRLVHCQGSEQVQRMEGINMHVECRRVTSCRLSSRCQLKFPPIFPLCCWITFKHEEHPSTMYKVFETWTM